MKILVPVDFFETSVSALRYATSLAKEVNGELVVLHVINGMMNTDRSVIDNPRESIKRASVKRLNQFIDKVSMYRGEDPIRVSKVVSFGLLGRVISEYVDANDVDLIIMGTRDTHGIFDRLLGSTSIFTVNASTCPVLLIHESTRWTKPKKIVFAIDRDTEIGLPLEMYHAFNEVLSADTDFFHVDVNSTDDIESQKDKITKIIKEDNRAIYSFRMKRQTSKTLKSGLMHYCMFEDIDMIAIVHRRRGAFERIFRRSNSVDIGTNVFLPVLILKER